MEEERAVDGNLEKEKTDEGHIETCRWQERNRMRWTVFLLRRRGAAGSTEWSSSRVTDV